MYRILIIDDEEEIRIALQRVLSREGYEIDLSPSVENAIDKMKRGELFSVVISDILMPGLTGIDFIKYISESNLNLPVILITGNPDLNSAESAVRYKAFDYISKPVDRNQILSVVKKAIDTKINKDTEQEKIHLSEKLEKALRTQNLDLNRQNAAILNATSDAVITIDSKLCIVSANKASFSLFGYSSPIELIGRPIHLLFPTEKMEKYMNQTLNLLAENTETKTLQLSDATLLKSNGDIFLADIAICNYSLDGENYYTGIVRDVTQKKLMVEQLILSERRAFLSIVAASIGHEINNSLTAIQGFVEMAMRENADMNLKDRALKVTLNQTDKLRALTSNLLQLGKDKSDNSIPKEGININHEITTVLSVFKETAKLKYCQIQWEEPSDEFLIRINSDQFSLILSNILLNAADATDNIGTIQIKTSSIENRVLMEVIDDGKGMNSETLEKIYEPYFTTKELGKGTGLGMFVVKQIIDSLNISLVINSNPKQGSSFLFSFPKA